MADECQVFDQRASGSALVPLLASRSAEPRDQCYFFFVAFNRKLHGRFERHRLHYLQEHLFFPRYHIRHMPFHCSRSSAWDSFSNRNFTSNLRSVDRENFVTDRHAGKIRRRTGVNDAYVAAKRLNYESSGFRLHPPCPSDPIIWCDGGDLVAYVGVGELSEQLLDTFLRDLGVVEVDDTQMLKLN